MKIRVLIAEDQAMVRGALAALLALEHDIEVVAQVAGGDQVVPAALEHRPEVALLDIEVPGMDGLAALAALREAPGGRSPSWSMAATRPVGGNVGLRGGSCGVGDRLTSPRLGPAGPPRACRAS
jgi:CheY-like chemotaxis protein